MKAWLAPGEAAGNLGVGRGGAAHPDNIIDANRHSSPLPTAKRTFLRMLRSYRNLANPGKLA